MAEPLKNSFGADIPLFIAEAVSDLHPDFDAEAFVAACLTGYNDLELTDRARQVADVLADHLPSDRDEALRILIDSLPPSDEDDLTGMEGFRYLPHVYFVAEYGLDHFDTAMEAQYQLTKLFTAEFSIRRYLDRYPDATLDVLRRWATDPDVHVRRLVSEGSRPRLPWAPRLQRFQDDPSSVIELLELLKDDPEGYVRRSVANNLNDITKDNPATVLAVARRWQIEADTNRRRLLRHGLRTLVKQGNPEALAILGFDPDAPLQVAAVRIVPDRPAIGQRVRIEVDVHNPCSESHGALIDLIVHFVKANDTTSAKVFKGAERVLDAGQRTTVRKTVSLAQHSTRTHYSGRHQVEVQLNGVVVPAGSFELLPEKSLAFRIFG